MFQCYRDVIAPLKSSGRDDRALYCGPETRSYPPTYEQVPPSYCPCRRRGWPAGIAAVLIRMLTPAVYASATLRLPGAEAMFQD